MISLGRLFLRPVLFLYDGRPELGRLKLKIELLKADPPEANP